MDTSSSFGISPENSSEEVTAVEVVQAHLDHIKRHNSQIKAVSVLAADEALESARQADQELSAGSSEVGPLHGVPITLKDHAIVKGLRTTLGTAAILELSAFQGL